MGKAIECAKAIVDMSNGDMYEDEEDGNKFSDESINKWTEKYAKKFCIDHIQFIIGVNGGSEYLWFAELETIKELKLYDDVGISKETVENMLKEYDKWVN